MKITIDTEEKIISIHKECNVLDLINTLHKLIGDTISEYKLIVAEQQPIYIQERVLTPLTNPLITYEPNVIYYDYDTGTSIKDNLIITSGSSNIPIDSNITFNTIPNF